MQNSRLQHQRDLTEANAAIAESERRLARLRPKARPRCCDAGDTRNGGRRNSGRPSGAIIEMGRRLG
jgi:hypothetical protein